jgi:RimJ/RimL family protein N-acetyltransferase
MIICETERLILREVVAEDAPFILTLLNDPDFIRFIADRNVRTLNDARAYIAARMTSSYEQNGFGMWLVIRKNRQMPIGLCGLVKRDSLHHPDIGFAFMPEGRGGGYASEAATAALAYTRRSLGLSQVLAIADEGNQKSDRLLRQLGFATIGVVKLSQMDNEVVLYAMMA